MRNNKVSGGPDGDGDFLEFLSSELRPWMVDNGALGRGVSFLTW